VEQDLMASSVGIGSGSIRADLDEFGARSGRPSIRTRRSRLRTFGTIKGAGDRSSTSGTLRSTGSSSQEPGRV